MRTLFVLICSLALVGAVGGETESKKQASHTKSSQHVATHTEHSTGGSTHLQHPQAPQHPATAGGHPQSGGTVTRPTGPESHPETGPAGHAAVKPATSAPPAPVYHYNFPTKSGLIGRDFARPLTPEEQSTIARQIANGQPAGAQPAASGYQYGNGIYHYNFPTKSGLIGRDFTRLLTPEEQSAIAREIEKGQAEGTQVRPGVASTKAGVNPFPSRHFDLPKTQGPGIETVKFQAGGHIPKCEEWRDSRYNVFRKYTTTWHDADWWRSHHTRIVFVLGGWYYWHANYWFPAWGYEPSSVYSYDGPIYAFNNLEPDQVVANVQATLQQLGYYHGPVNGVLDTSTREAIANYQADHGLYTTSVIDEPTLAALGMA
jgi:hypothetical protein